MRQQYRLRALKVRIARQHVSILSSATSDERTLKLMQQTDYLVDLVLQIEPYIERDLIVSRPSRMELAAKRAYQALIKRASTAIWISSISGVKTDLAQRLSRDSILEGRLLSFLRSASVKTPAFFKTAACAMEPRMS